ncbi:MAG: leucine-rich repeat protein, partial [Prevotellaceae bacterium]|nr:leucine-rich repeat protein [Prevotellaceae bacterium]
MKKLISITFSLVLSVTLHAVEVASGTCGDNLTWTFDHEGLLTRSGTGDMDDFQGFSLPWFGHDIKSVTISDGVTSIGTYAFYHYNNLTSVSIGNSVTKIGNSAFQGCAGLTEFIIPDAVKTIGDESFADCTGLMRFAIGSGVTHIGTRALGRCSSLAEIYVDDANQNYSSSMEGILFDKTQTTLIQYPLARADWEMQPYNIPAPIIGDYAFAGCTGLTGITLGYVDSIGRGAFSGCNIELVNCYSPEPPSLYS